MSQLDNIVTDGIRLISTFLMAFVATFIAPLIIWILRLLKLERIQKEQQEVRELATLHNSKAQTPTMGCIIIIFSTLVAVLSFVMELSSYRCNELFSHTRGGWVPR